MNRKSLVATIHAQCAEDFIAASYPDGTGGAYVPIFERPYDSESMGIDTEGFWCVSSNERMWSPKTFDQFYVFYCLLYSQLREVVDSIKEGLGKNSIPVQAAYTFPFDGLIYSAMKASSHWRDHALKWIDQGYPLNDEMRFILCGEDPQNKDWLNWQKQRLSPVLSIGLSNTKTHK